jgi:hypothetical protein
MYVPLPSVSEKPKDPLGKPAGFSPLANGRVST